MTEPNAENPSSPTIVPTGELLKLRPADVRPNVNNPRILFDEEPLRDLRDNIRVHGVLVPITVYPLPGSSKYAILDGARRHRCCVELEAEGKQVDIPANVVKPPDKLAGLLYMFSIHNFREQWELMPTALSLRIVMDELGEADSKKLSHLTGLSEPQIERCKTLLDVPPHLQQLSLDPNPKTRIPSNFWIEADPVVDLVETELPELWASIGREGLLEQLVAKYRAKRIRSVIHFRRIVEAFELVDDDPDGKQRVVSRLDEYLKDMQLETRRAFDEFIVDARRAMSAVRACEHFVSQVTRAKVEHAIDEDRIAIMRALGMVNAFVSQLLVRLEGTDPPPVPDGDDASGANGQ